jgi:hypothetical protein
MISFTRFSAPSFCFITVHRKKAFLFIQRKQDKTTKSWWQFIRAFLMQKAAGKGQNHF